MANFKALSEAVSKGDVKTAVAETQIALDTGSKVQDILDRGLIAAMDEVGSRYSRGLIFVPQMLRSAKTMKECVRVLEPFFQGSDVTSKGKILIGTVKGDLHDIGKNLVAMMLEGAGFMIVDLGVDISPDKFARKAQEEKPQILGMSALLSTTMPAMRRTIETLAEAGVRARVKVMIGGAPVTEQYAREIKADSYASDAGSAVSKAKELLGVS